jgi:hypothetical protein
MQNVGGCQPTIEPEKLCYETQIDSGDGNRGNKEGPSKKSEKSSRRKRRRKARTFGYLKGRRKKPNATSTTEEGREIHQQRDQIHKL